MYVVEISSRAEREFRKFERDVQNRIHDAFQLLAQDPRPPNAIKMKNTLTVVDLRLNLSDALGRVRHGHERIVITKSGKPVAGLIPFDELEAIEALEEKLDREVLEDARKEGGSRPFSDLAKDLGLG